MFRFRRTAGLYSKHIERRMNPYVQVFKMRELVSTGRVKLFLLIGTDHIHNPADLFTKVLDRDQYRKFHHRATNPYGVREHACVAAKRRPRAEQSVLTLQPTCPAQIAASHRRHRAIRGAR